MTNSWCQALGIAVPRLESVVGHRDANTFSLMLIALLEAGVPMTLEQIAKRFDAAGVADADCALASLKRCKPARPPVYRDGDFYALDPHDDDLDLWVFRLGLRPPRVTRAAPPEPTPRPNDVRLDDDELDAFLRAGYDSAWSETRVALAVLDAKGPLPSEEVVRIVHEHVRWGFREPGRSIGRAKNPVVVHDDGRWSIAPDAGPALESMRAFVRERIARAAKRNALGPTPDLMNQLEQQRAVRAAELAKLTHALVICYPPRDPAMMVLVDVGARTLTTYRGDERAQLCAALARYDVVGGIDIRAIVRAVGFEPGDRRLADLAPPQKSLKLNRAGRTLKITPALIAQASCGISQPFGDESKLAGYLEAGEVAKLQRRLEADAKSLYALYQYGRLRRCSPSVGLPRRGLPCAVGASRRAQALRPLTRGR